MNEKFLNNHFNLPMPAVNTVVFRELDRLKYGFVDLESHKLSFGQCLSLPEITELQAPTTGQEFMTQIYFYEIHRF